MSYLNYEIPVRVVLLFKFQTLRNNLFSVRHISFQSVDSVSCFYNDRWSRYVARIAACIYSYYIIALFISSIRDLHEEEENRIKKKR